MSIVKIAFAFAVTALVTPASADGFRYAGSPKFGEFYVAAAAKASAAPQAALDANASIAPAAQPRSPFKGGIGNRAP